MIRLQSWQQQAPAVLIIIIYSVPCMGLIRNWNEQAPVQDYTRHDYFAPVLWIIAIFPVSTLGIVFSWNSDEQWETYNGQTEQIYLSFQIPLVTCLSFSIVKWIFASLPSINFAQLPLYFSHHLYSLLLIPEHRCWINAFITRSFGFSETIWRPTKYLWVPLSYCGNP